MSFFKNGALVDQLSSTATSGGTLTLTNTSRKYQVLTGTSNHTVKLPNATTMKNGMVFTIINRSTGTITVNYDDNSLAATLAAGISKDFVLFDNGTSNGSFDISTSSSSGGGASAADLQTLRAGQLSGYSLTSDQIQFNPEEISADVWVQKTSMATSVDRNPQFVLHGHLYNIGGQTNISTVERYNDSDNFWLTRTSVSASQGELSATFTLGEFGYSAGGNSAGSNLTSKYNDALDSWSAVATLPASRTDGMGTALNGYGHMFAGATVRNGTALNTNFRYDSTLDAWSQRQTLITARLIHASLTLNSFGYAIGGQDTGPSNLSSGEKYHDITNSWTSIATLPNFTAHCGGFVNLGLLYARHDGNNNIERYSDAANVWNSAMASPVSHGSTKGASLNGYGYQVGGGGTSRVDRYSGNSLFLSRIIKRSASVPTGLFVSAKLKNLTPLVTAQIRTDNDNWKTLSANVDSDSSFGDTLRGKFVESALGYVFGGDDAVSVYRTAVEFYNDAQNTWQNRTSLATARGYFGGFRLRGLGYIVSGSTAGGPVNTVLAYDDISDSFASKASISSARSNANGFLLNDYGFIAGGSGPVTTVERYDAGADSWLTRASLNTARSDHAAWVQNGRGYVNQGVGATTERYSDTLNSWTTVASSASSLSRKLSFAMQGYGYSSGGVSPSSVHERYDDQNNSWSTRTSMNSTRSYASGWFQNGFGYAAGGAQGSSPLSSSEQYNEPANTWTNKASMNTSRQALTSGISPGVYRNYEVRIGIPAYVSGLGAGAWISRTSTPTPSDNQGFGLGGFGYNPGISDDNRVQQYNPTSDTWKQIGSMANNKTRAPAFAVMGNGYVGGSNNSSTTAVEKLDPETLSWSSAAASTNAHNQGGGFKLNGFGYLAGSTSPATANVDKYNPSTNSWSAAASMPATREPGSGAGESYGFGYCQGGVGGSFSNTTIKYNDANDAWTSVANYIASILYGIMSFNGKFMHLAGGNDGSATTPTAEYNHLLNTWVQKDSLNTARYSGPGYYLNGNMYVSSGDVGVTATEQYLNNFNSLVMSVALDVDE